MTQRVPDALSAWQRSPDQGFARVFAAAPAAMVLSRLSDGLILDMNEACAKALGHTRDAAIGRTTVELGLWPDTAARDAVSRRLKDGVEGDTVLQLTVGGAARAFRLRAQVIELDGVRILLSTLSDETEHHQKLRESDDRFRASFMTGADAFAIVRRADGGLVDVNDQFVRMWGYAREECLGKTSVALGMWVDPTERLRFLAELEHHGKVRDFEVHARRKSGETFYVLYSATAMSVAGGPPLIFSAIRDVTEQRRARDAQRFSAELLQRAHVLARVGTYVVDVQAGIMRMSAEMAHLFGAGTCALTLPLDEYRARFLHPEESTAVRADEAYASNRQLAIESRIVRGDGRVIWVRASSGPELDADGKMIVVGVVQDVTEQHKALEDISAQTQRLRESELRFRTLIESAPVAIGISRVGVGVYYNRKFVELWGYSSQDALVGRGILGNWAPEAHEAVRRRLRLLAAGARSLPDEDQIALRADGSRFPAHVDVITVELPDGPANVAFCVDVTERNETRRKLEGRLAFETLLADITARFLEVPDDDIAGAIGDAQRQICAFFGFNRSSVFEPVAADPGKVAVAHIFPDERGIARVGALADAYFPWTVERLRTTRSTVVIPDTRDLPLDAQIDRENFMRIGNVTSVNVPWASPDGEILAIMAFNAALPRPLSADELREIETAARVVLVAFGRAKERRAKAQGQERMRVLTEMLDEAPAGVLVVDPSGRALYANRHVAAMHGFAVEEVVGLSLFDLLPPEDHEERRASIEALFENGGAALEAWHLRKDGSRFRVHVRVLRTTWGGQPALLSVQTDLTERDRAEEERRVAEERRRASEQQRDAAAEASRAKSRFLANMSHEIRTPMNAILGFTQLLLRDSSVTSEHRRHLETVSRAGDHLMFLIDGILQLAKIESGNESVALTPFDLWSLVDDLVRLFFVRANEKNLYLRLERHASVPQQIVADSGKLRQIISNLLGNAVKFTKDGGVVLRVNTRAAGNERYLTVEVADTGPGIDPSEISCLFEKFEQTATGRASHQGTGLGLAISRELVTLMGGEIGVASQPGVGTTFRFDVPMTEVSARQPATGSPSHSLRLAPGQRALRVLVADDVEDNRTLLVNLLRSAGFDAEQCADGAEAVMLFEQWRPSVVLMDLRMPGMDGFEAIRRIRRLPAGDAVKIICVTASAYDADESAALAVGTDDFIKKPVRDVELLERVARLVGAQLVDVNVSDTTDLQAAASASMAAPSVARLPKAVRDDLRRATLGANFTRMLALLDAAREHDERATAALRSLAECFGYGQILELLDAADSEDVQTQPSGPSTRPDAAR